MGQAESSDICLLGWCTLAVDGDQFMVELVEVGVCCILCLGYRDGQSSAVSMSFTLSFVVSVQSPTSSPLLDSHQTLMCLMLWGSHMEQAYLRTGLTKDLLQASCFTSLALIFRVRLSSPRVLLAVTTDNHLTWCAHCCRLEKNGQKKKETHTHTQTIQFTGIRLDQSSYCSSPQGYK